MNEGRAGSAGKANHSEAEAVQRLAEEVLAGEHGPIGITINLAEGQCILVEGPVSSGLGRERPAALDARGPGDRRGGAGEA